MERSLEGFGTVSEILVEKSSPAASPPAGWGVSSAPCHCALGACSWEQLFASHHDQQVRARGFCKASRRLLLLQPRSRLGPKVSRRLARGWKICWMRKDQERKRCQEARDTPAKQPDTSQGEDAAQGKDHGRPCRHWAVLLLGILIPDKPQSARNVARNHWWRQAPALKTELPFPLLEKAVSLGMSRRCAAPWPGGCSEACCRLEHVPTSRRCCRAHPGCSRTGPHRHACRGPDTILPSSRPCCLQMLRPYKTLLSPRASTAVSLLTEGRRKPPVPF